MSLSRRQPHPPSQQSRRRRSSQSCSRARETRSALAWSLPWRGRAALSLQQADTASKRLELLREVVPNLRRLAIMGNMDNPASVLEMREIREACAALGLEVDALEIRRAEDIAPAFDALKGRAEALY